ncbi:uncharacterized protein [Neodiprion pinetum]|uniref:uncharacterized protein isoform X1 n=1 Tax=Neodiprion pinetum TaxID=441929 RepID=UPI001EDE930F|nr:uncharacterized protein LOC124213673 isoform X1 [Neodiprion pinetum]
MDSSGSAHRSNSVEESTRNVIGATLKEQKAVLRKEIQELEELNFQIECCLNISKFGDIKHLFDFSTQSLIVPSKRLPDTDTEYIDQLYRLAGMHCTKFTENEYIFNFVSSSVDTADRIYTVQVTCVSDKLKLGKWVMPMSINMNSILLQTPLTRTCDLKSFLMNCKHHIECYTNRVKQYNEFQVFLTDQSGCYLDSNFGHTLISLTLFGMQELDSGNLYNITLHLVYKSDRVRPHEMKIDSLDSKNLKRTTTIKFKAYFKNFKCSALKKGFQKTTTAIETHVAWTKGNYQNAEELDLSVTGIEGRSTPSAEDGSATKSRRVGKKLINRQSNHKNANISLHSYESATRKPSSVGPNSELVETCHLSMPNPVYEMKEKYGKRKGKRQSTNNTPKSRNEAAHTSAVPKASSEKLTSIKNLSHNSNLKQSTLRFELEKKNEIQNKTPTTELLTSTRGKTVSQKLNMNLTGLKNHKFGTSTPVSNLIRNKRQFVADDNTEVSPIISKRITNSKRGRNV